MNCLSTISSSLPCHATPNPTVPLRAGACRTLEGTLVRMFYRLFLVPSRAAPSRGRPLLANAGHSAPSLDNTRRMAISNHLSTVASSMPLPTSPRLTQPLLAVPDRTLEETLVRMFNRLFPVPCHTQPDLAQPSMPEPAPPLRARPDLALLTLEG